MSANVCLEFFSGKGFVWDVLSETSGWIVLSKYGYVVHKKFWVLCISWINGCLPVTIPSFSGDYWQCCSPSFV